MHDGVTRFESALSELQTIASIDAAGVNACLENYARYKDQESAEMLATSFAYGLRQLAHLRSEILLLVIDGEIAAAASHKVS